jgi:hypothetical protein
MERRAGEVPLPTGLIKQLRGYCVAYRTRVYLFEGQGNKQYSE